MALVSDARARQLGLAARLSVSVALVYWVCRRVDFAALAGGLRRLTWSELSAALAFTALTPLLGALRWRRVLARIAHPVALRELLADLLVGSAYNLVLPTSMGGDVMRALRCAPRAGSRAAAVTSVLFERLLGLVSLAVAALLGALTAESADRGSLSRLALGALVVLGLTLWQLGRIFSLAARLAAFSVRASRALGSVANLLGGALGAPSALAETLAWSIAYQLANLSIIGVVLFEAGEPRWAAAVYLGLPSALLLSALPISVGGFGLREALFVNVLAGYGVSAERALLLALLWVLSSLVLALAGLLVLVGERACKSVSSSG